MINVRKLLIYICVFSVIGFTIFKMVQTTDEIGYLGAGKVGRQVLIQSLDAISKPRARVDSDFFDRPFIVRLILGEPLRTTIRFDFQEEEVKKITLEMVKQYLNLPHETITQFFQSNKGKILLQKGYELEVNEFRKILKEKNVKTIEDFYAGFGFNKYEVYVRGKPKFSIKIRNVKNVKHIG